VDQDGEMVDVYFQAKRDGLAAKRFFERLLRSHGGEPRQIVTDKLRSYGVAHREMIPDSIHCTIQYANNRAEQSHEATRIWGQEFGVRVRILKKSYSDPKFPNSVAPNSDCRVVRGLTGGIESPRDMGTHLVF
jgi:transposase-like protein